MSDPSLAQPEADAAPPSQGSTITPSSDGLNEYTASLVKGFAHKLNNILTIFHGYSSLLLSGGELPPDLKESVLEIKKGAEAASGLLDRTLAVIRRSTPQGEPVSTRAFADGLAATLDREFGPRVSMASSPDATTIRTDPTRLRQALLELVRNAVQASPEDRPVQVEIGPAPGWVGMIRLAVIDHGPGIAAEMRPRIFEPFFSMKKQAGCLGLGLPIAQNLVQQLGGQIRIHVEPDGCVAEILLPAD